MQASGHIYCGSCGHAVQAGLRFCTRCGQPLETHALAPAAPQLGKRLAALVGLGVVALGVAVAILLSRSAKAPARTVLDHTEAGPRIAPQQPSANSPLIADLGGGVRMVFVRIPPGEFVMGSDAVGADERPAHRARITRDCELGKYEVTQAQWEALMASNPSSFKGADRPVEMVSWNDVQEFLAKLNARRDGYRYRLPTEAEWEYAARAGAGGDSAGDMDAAAWLGRNSDNQTHPVGQKQPNAWGVYDMFGNVWEWCQDWYDEGYYQRSPLLDPGGPPTGQLRVLRGSGWSMPEARSAMRGRNTVDSRHDYNGFRCVRERTR